MHERGSRFVARSPLLFDRIPHRPSSRAELLHKLMRWEAALSEGASDWESPGRGRFAALHVAHQIRRLLVENRTEGLPPLKQPPSRAILYGPPAGDDDVQLYSRARGARS